MCCDKVASNESEIRGSDSGRLRIESRGAAAARLYKGVLYPSRDQVTSTNLISVLPNIVHNMDTYIQRDFLASVLSLPLTSPSPSRPYVTLTYAQSLDGCIAGVGGKQLLLSGKESMIMTHWCCSYHTHCATLCSSVYQATHHA